MRIRSVAVAVALAIAVCATGCTSRDNPAPEASGGAGTTTTAPATPPTVKVKATARGDGDGPTLARAATRATPELEGFLTRYARAAFDPRAGTGRARTLAPFFDKRTRGTVARDVAALSIGSAGSGGSVRVEPATARVALLVDGGRPLAATVRLSLRGSAERADGATPVRLDATFQLVRGKGGWAIAAYDSHTEGAA